MPEWGNPGDECRLSMAESIGHVKPTRGSETSQYPQEEKAIRDSLSSGERNGMSLNRAAVKPVGVGSAAL